MGRKQTLEQVLKEAGLIDEWIDRGKAEGIAAVAQNLVNLGLPFETVVSATELDPEKIKPLYTH